MRADVPGEKYVLLAFSTQRVCSNADISELSPVMLLLFPASQLQKVTLRFGIVADYLSRMDIAPCQLLPFVFRGYDRFSPAATGLGFNLRDTMA